MLLVKEQLLVLAGKGEQQGRREQVQAKGGAVFKAEGKE